MDPLSFTSLLSGGAGGLNFAPSATSGGDPNNRLGGMDIIRIGGSGMSTGQTLLLMGAVAFGAYLLWRK